MMLRLFLFVLCALPLRAATVVLTLTGRVSETDVGSYFSPAPVSVGDLWQVQVTYSYPTPPTGGGIGVSSYSDPNGRLDFAVHSLFWTGQGANASVRFDYPFGDTVFWDHSLFSPAPLVNGDPRSTFLMTFAGGMDMVADASSMPSSFAQWNLPASTFELDVITQYGLGANFWHIKANQFDTISIQVIPEPSAAGFALTIAVAALGRRGRMRP